jgi:hypothetical protein
MSMKTVVAAMVTFTIVALGAGCGGDGDSLSREQLIEQGDAICADYASRIDEIGQPQPGNANDIERFVDEAKPVVEEGTDALDDLTPPEDLEGEYDEWIALGRGNVTAFEDLEAAAAEGDEQRMEEITERLGADQGEAARIAQRIGFQECIGGP